LFMLFGKRLRPRGRAKMGRSRPQADRPFILSPWGEDQKLASFCNMPDGRRRAVEPPNGPSAEALGGGAPAVQAKGLAGGG
jgi:hypothetical protein